MRLSPFNDLPRRRQIRYSSTEAPAPPLLTKIKGDLKAAMKAKDTPRLNVLRAMITEYNNASKTSTPVKTDLQLLAVLRKKKAAGEAAAAEAKAANRKDLEEKQMQEIKVIDEYAGEVDVMSEEEVYEIVRKGVENMKRNITSGNKLKTGEVLKHMFSVSDLLGDKPVDKAQVAKMVSQVLEGQ